MKGLLKAAALALVAVSGFSQTSKPAAKPHTQPSASVTAGLSGQIDKLIEPQSHADLFSGVILLQRGDHVIFQRAYGFANWELRVPNNKDTRFGIAFHYQTHDLGAGLDAGATASARPASAR